MWEPSWEPTSANSHRRPWTQTESKLLCSRLNGLRWTPRVAALRSTDQEVEGSSPSERADEILPMQGLVARRAREPSDVWELFAHSTTSLRTCKPSNPSRLDPVAMTFRGPAVWWRFRLV